MRSVRPPVSLGDHVLGLAELRDRVRAARQGDRHAAARSTANELDQRRALLGAHLEHGHVLRERRLAEARPRERSALLPSLKMITAVGAGGDRVRDLHREVAGAALDERDVAGEAREVLGLATGVRSAVGLADRQRHDDVDLLDDTRERSRCPSSPSSRCPRRPRR